MVTIDGYPLDLVETEQHERSADVTEHPVEEGADVSDNVRVKPRELTLTNAVVSDTPIGAIADDPTRQGVEGPISQDAYFRLNKVFEARQPVTVVTDLQQYKSMILDKLTITQEAKSSHGLVFVAHFKEVIIVSNRRVTTGQQRNLGHQTTASLIPRDAVQVYSYPLTGPAAGGASNFAAQHVVFGGVFNDPTLTTQALPGDVITTDRSFGPPKPRGKILCFNVQTNGNKDLQADGYVLNNTYHRFTGRQGGRMEQVPGHPGDYVWVPPGSSVKEQVSKFPSDTVDPSFIPGGSTITQNTQPSPSEAWRRANSTPPPAGGE
jgi:hypothetical protein